MYAVKLSARSNKQFENPKNSVNTLNTADPCIPMFLLYMIGVEMGFRGTHFIDLLT